MNEAGSVMLILLAVSGSLVEAAGQQTARVQPRQQRQASDVGGAVRLLVRS